MSFYSKLRGTFESLFQLGGTSGPQLKANSGVVEARNTGDSAYAQVRGADPTIADDLVTKRYFDANAGSGSSVPLVVHAGTQYKVSANTQVTASVPILVEAGASILVEAGAVLVGVVK